MATEMLDATNLQEIFTTHLGALEDAGDGMVRVIRCIKRNDLLVPVAVLIIPAMNILKEHMRYKAVADMALHGEMALH